MYYEIKKKEYFSEFDNGDMLVCIFIFGISNI